MADPPRSTPSPPACRDSGSALSPHTRVGSWGLRIGRMAKGWHAHRRDVGATVDAITADAVQSIPGADSACIVRIDRTAAPTCWGATDAVALSASQLEQAVQEGPSSTALTDNDVVTVDQVASDPRWPAYSAGAADLGVGSVLAVPLESGDRVVAALTVFGEQDDAFSPDTVAGAELFATHVGIALATAKERADLSAAIESRTVIGQAKGILMERYRLTDEQAFGVLVKASQQSNVPLRDIAHSLSRTGSMPEEPPG